MQHKTPATQLYPVSQKRKRKKANKNLSDCQDIPTVMLLVPCVPSFFFLCLFIDILKPPELHAPPPVIRWGSTKRKLLKGCC